MDNPFCRIWENANGVTVKKAIGFRVGDVVKVLDNGAQGVAVRGNQNHLAGLNLRDNGLLPVGQQALQDVLKALGDRNGLTGVARVGVLGELGSQLNRR